MSSVGYQTYPAHPAQQYAGYSAAEWAPRNPPQSSPELSVASTSLSSGSPVPPPPTASAKKAARATKDAAAPRKRKPGPMRKKCVWCSLTHGHFCSAGKCAVRNRLNGIGSDSLLELCRSLKKTWGEDLRLALESEGEAGVLKLKKKTAGMSGGKTSPSSSPSAPAKSRPANAGVKKAAKSPKAVTKKPSPAMVAAKKGLPIKKLTPADFPNKRFVDKLAILSLVCTELSRTQGA